jgi:hypothetical protein
MPLNLDTANIASESDIQGESNRPAVGRYLAVVKSAEERETKEKGLQGVNIEFEVLGGTTPGQAGQTLPAWFSYEGEDEAKTRKALLRCTRLALSLGLLQPGQPQAVAVDFESQAPGRLIVIEVAPNTFTNKNGQKIDSSQLAYMGMWSMGNPEVADVMAITEVREAAQAVLGPVAPQPQQPEQVQQQAPPAVNYPPTPEQVQANLATAGNGNGNAAGQAVQQQPAQQPAQQPVQQQPQTVGAGSDKWADL